MSKLREGERELWDYYVRLGLLRSELLHSGLLRLGQLCSARYSEGIFLGRCSLATVLITQTVLGYQDMTKNLCNRNLSRHSGLRSWKLLD